MHEFITNNLDLWTAALLTNSTTGRNGNGKQEAYGLKKLRKLILDLAVRGKLVPQDTRDEPASVLLEKIADEKKRLVNAGRANKQTALPEIDDAEKLYRLPPGWEWERLGNLFDIQDYRRIPVNSAERATRDGPYPYYGANGQVGFIDNYLFEGERILVAEDGGFFDDPIRGVAYVVDGKFWVNNHAHVLECLGNTNAKYWVSYFNRMDWKPLVRGMTRDKLNQVAMVQIVMPVPPLAEQQRIAAKADELMAVCDQLEQQQTHSIDAHQTLVENLLGTLTRVESQQELTEAWSRIANHFDTLFTTENSVESLKQTILELAVMGKLSSPQKSDTPIEALLDAISIERRQLGMTTKEAERFEAEYHAAKKGIVNKRINLKARFFCGFITKGTTPSSHELLPDGDVPFLKVYNIVNNRLDFGYKPIFISNNVHQTKLKRSVIYPGDVIMNIVGPPLGKVAVVTEEYPEWNMNQALAVFRPLGGINNKYIHYMLTSGRVLKSVLSEVKGTAGQDNLSLEQCRDLLIPIPSLEEQHRIVARVDEIMALSDALRARLVKAQITQIHLADAIVAQELA